MTSRRSVSSANPWEAVVGYSRAVRVGQHVWVAGTTAAAPDGGAPVGGDDAHAQAVEALRRVLAALAEVGRAHGEVFGAVRPASTMVEVSRLIQPGLLVEVEAEAWVGD